MSPGKRFEAESDAIYIEGHLEEIVELKQEYGERNRNLDKKEVLRAVINYNRAHSMFDEMYPDYDKLPIGKQFELEGVQAHIVDNVENILKLKRQNERNYPNMTPVDATRYAVEESMSSAKPKKR